MSQARIVVIGSSNTDMVVKAERIPRAGETVLGGDFVMVPGGKGATQAVCAARLGAEVRLVARIGADVFGDASIENLKRSGVGIEFIVRDSARPSGVALISVDAAGENAIVVAPGANHALSPEDVDRAADEIARADAVILQLEIPLETVIHTIGLARSRNTMVVLNPAPIRPIDVAILRYVDVLVPNQHEAAGLLGRSAAVSDTNAEAAAEGLIALGPKNVAITLGSQGAYVANACGRWFVDALKVKALDTTAAGDAFTASLACGLAEGLDLLESARFAARVAAISVTRMGAQSSMPTREEVESFDPGN